MSKPFYDLQTSEDKTAALLELRGFWKFWSSCLLNQQGLPTLRGIVVMRQDPEIKKGICKFLDDINSDTVLIRHDKFPEAPPYPRGGFLVGENLLKETKNYFFALGRIVALYEPADPLLNGYNINLLFEDAHEIKIEIVGPGFDMSDIKRGDLSPHESFSVRLSSKGQISESKLLGRISESAYVESVKERKQKIKDKLYASPEPALAHKIRQDLGIPDDVDEHLREIGSPLCNSHRYQPISEEVLCDTVEKIVESETLTAYPALSGAKYPFVFSTSFVNKGQKQVFWDVVSPALKYQGL